MEHNKNNYEHCNDENWHGFAGWRWFLAHLNTATGRALFQWLSGVSHWFLHKILHIHTTSENVVTINNG